MSVRCTPELTFVVERRGDGPVTAPKASEVVLPTLSRQTHCSEAAIQINLSDWRD